MKEVSKQIVKNTKVEICAFKNGEWVRVACILVEDGNTQVFYMKDATATFSSFTSEPTVIVF